jgi:hypothetical protein
MNANPFVSIADLKVLVAHYEVEENRWRDESPDKHRLADADLAFWRNVLSERLNDATA